MSTAEMFQSIYDIIQDFVSGEYKRLLYAAAFTQGSYQMRLYIDNGEGWVDCRSLDYSRSDVIKLYMKLNSAIKPYRSTLPEKELWTMLTLVIEDTGKFKADFCYDDLSESMIEHFEQWENKYLS